MLVLGIETSGRAGNIALVQDQTLLAERELTASGRRHARTLVPEIREILKQLKLSLSDLGGVAVSIGPGSFTGLRVGVVCAKTLSYSLECPVSAVDTFLSVAEACTPFAGTLHVIDDALRGDVYAGAYTYSNESGWQVKQSPLLISIEDFCSMVTEQDQVSGPGVSKLLPDLPELNFVEESLRAPNAKQVALVGERRLAAGLIDDCWRIEPHYIRRSAAEEKADQTAQ